MARGWRGVIAKDTREHPAMTEMFYIMIFLHHYIVTKTHQVIYLKLMDFNKADLKVHTNPLIHPNIALESKGGEVQEADIFFKTSLGL